MSYLIKISLLFMVLSIVCNLTFSYDVEECKANVHLVFLEDLDPFFAFNFGLYSLSEKVIRSMTTTGILSNSLIIQYGTLNFNYQREFDNSFVIGYAIGRQNLSISESNKHDIFGYFKYLVKKFNTISEHIRTEVKSPIKFCEEEYGNDEEDCRKALSIMLNQPVDELHNMSTDNALNHCYLNYDYFEFTNDSIFSASGSSSSTNSTLQPQLKKKLLDIMDTYLRHLIKKINLIVRTHLEHQDPQLLPTVEEYCKDPEKNKT